MKKIPYFILCASLFFVSSIDAFAVEFIRWDENGCINISSNIDIDSFKGYTKFEGDWYYGLCPMKDVDDKSFKILDVTFNYGKPFAKDKSHVYFTGDIMKDISPESFQADEFELKATSTKFDNTEFERLLVQASDTKYIWSWYGGLLVNGITLEDFIIRGSGLDDDSDAYYSDNEHVYQKTEHKEKGYAAYYTLDIVPDTDPEHFYFGYEITDDAVYWYGKKIEGADPGSFELFHLGYAKDKDNVYYEGEVKYGVDTKSFAELGGNFIDKNAEYDDGKIFQNIKGFKQQYIDNNKSTEIVNEPIKESLLEYKEKYPGYRPQPAIDPENPPKHPLLDRVKDIITDYKYLNPPLYYLILIGPFVALFGVIGFVLWKKRICNK